jgi:hypothetical protein
VGVANSKGKVKMNNDKLSLFSGHSERELYQRGVYLSEFYTSFITALLFSERKMSIMSSDMIISEICKAIFSKQLLRYVVFINLTLIRV